MIELRASVVFTAEDARNDEGAEDCPTAVSKQDRESASVDVTSATLESAELRAGKRTSELIKRVVQQTD